MTAVGLANTRTAAWFERLGAFVAVFLIAVRYRFPPDIPIGFLVALALLPVSGRFVLRYRGVALIGAATIVAAVSGQILTLAAVPSGQVNGSLLTVQTWRVVGILLVVAALLWARSTIGSQRLIVTFALGSVASLAFTGVNFDNIWKYSLAVPVTLLSLSLPFVYGRRLPQLIVVLVLAAVSAFGDSRSSAGMLLIAAALTFLQRRRGSVAATKGRAWAAIGQLALVGVGAYLVIQAAILEGALGAAVESRTEAQIAQSGSAIVGGRPEMGAAVALISGRPWGFGAGSLVSYDDLRIAKEGMLQLGYDPNNGYVEKYMFGYGYEVHSVLGDLWILFGIAGAVLAVLIVGYALFGLGLKMVSGTAATIVIFLTLRLTWDLAFSPFASAMIYLPLALAITLPKRDAGPELESDDERFSTVSIETR